MNIANQEPPRCISHSRLRNGRRLIAVFCAMFVVVYISSFCGLRKYYSIARGLPFFDEEYTGCRKRLVVYYFSQTPRTNELCYVLFFPIHRWLLSGYPEDADISNCDIAGVYLRSKEALDQFQVGYQHDAHIPGPYIEGGEGWRELIENSEKITEVDETPGTETNNIIKLITIPGSDADRLKSRLGLGKGDWEKVSGTVNGLFPCDAPIKDWERLEKGVRNR